MEKNSEQPMEELTALLGEITKMPLGPERDKKWEEAYALFEPVAEELSLLRGTIRVLAERNQNGETLKDFMKQAGVDISPTAARIDQMAAWPRRSPIDVIQSGFRSVRNLWDRKKGAIAIGMTLTAVLFFYANQRNIKMLHDFTHDENLVGLFEDWLGLVDPQDEEDRETPLNWRDLEDAKDV
jgi:hypothetical protein